MSTEITPPEDLFDRLIEALPKMAEAVNAFTIKDNQRLALQALLTAAGVPTVPTVARKVPAPPTVVPDLQPEEAGEETDAIPAASEPAAEATKTTRVRKPAGKKSYARMKDINFRPEGKDTLRDFWAQKEPANNHEKNLVIVYYFEEYLEVTAIEVGHVLAGYDEVGVKSPALPDNSLVVTASQKNWLDTSDMKAIKTTHSGRNTIQYDMPIKKDKRSA